MHSNPHSAFNTTMVISSIKQAKSIDSKGWHYDTSDKMCINANYVFRVWKHKLCNIKFTWNSQEDMMYYLLSTVDRKQRLCRNVQN